MLYTRDKMIYNNIIEIEKRKNEMKKLAKNSTESQIRTALKAGKLFNEPNSIVVEKQGRNIFIDRGSMMYQAKLADVVKLNKKLSFYIA